VAAPRFRPLPEKLVPRFVILEHDYPVLHWDLMLEAGDVLQTWRLAVPPMEAAVIEAAALGDHRRMYLDYEGPVSGKRGNVRRWDAGNFIEEVGSTPRMRLLRLDGTRLAGCWRLEYAHDSIWRFAQFDFTESAATC
jgi:DNA polymerase Ligase (LigD)